jgi:hypothetical protein
MFEEMSTVADRFRTTGRGLDAMDAVAKWALADDKRDAFETLHTIAVMIDTLRGMYAGKISAAETEAEILTIWIALMGTIDVDQKFDPEGA